MRLKVYKRFGSIIDVFLFTKNISFNIYTKLDIMYIFYLPKKWVITYIKGLKLPLPTYIPKI